MRPGLPRPMEAGAGRVMDLQSLRGLPEAKKAMRTAGKTRRAALPQPLREILSALAAARLETWAPYRRARAVMAFASFTDEIITMPLLKQVLDSGRELILPVTVRSRPDLELRRVGELAGLVPGRWGIPEPGPGCPAVGPSQVELVIVPGIAFDERGHRTGYGGGYYDRLLRALRRGTGRPPPACGFGYEVQVWKQVPAGPDDEPLDALVTDAALREFGGEAAGLGGIDRA